MPSTPITLITLIGAQGGYLDRGGPGRALVLLISPFSTAAVYQPTIDALARSFRVIAVEMPGSGRAARLRPAWGLAEYANWVIALLAALNLGPVILVGHSHSGAVALHVAARAATRLRALVLVDAVGAGGPRIVLETLAACALCLPMEARFVARSVPRLAWNLAVHGCNFLRQLFVASRADVRVATHRVTTTTPTLLAWGANDYVEPLSSLRRLARWLPAARVYVSTRGSHDWLIERPAEFAAAVTCMIGPPAMLLR